MKLLSLSLGLTALALLQGCVSNSALPPVDRSIGAVEFTEKLKVSTSGNGLDSMIVSMSGDLTDKPTYKRYDTWWCPRHEQINSAEKVAEKYAQLCNRKGGELKSWFCRDKNDEYNVHFYSGLKVTTQQSRKPLCSMGESVEMTVIAPKGDTMDKYYLQALKRVGYKKNPANRSY
ncbi:hypothetical protein A3752_14965 [Oleiphilus sp. HI0081]|nr:hypothetical protein A3743_14150 [Oleiphilus sp. HI0072]KZZ11205.1 hypothetical protein A3749_09480 [Oleiphilus sp. HI0078]KZZ19317.1 hypothetical protein A3752_14965 [Oleiphilus sp. HI0081]